MAAVLVDTSLLVYAHDRGEPEKQQQSIYLLDTLEATRQGYLTAQVLGEFFRATTRPHAAVYPSRWKFRTCPGLG
jgi:predicted nucleic acid-binding protein